MNEQRNSLREADNSNSGKVRGRNSRRDVAVAFLLVSCVVIVGFWETMAGRNRRGFDLFQLTAEDFSEFTPIFKGWSVRELKIENDSVEPNILAYLLDPKGPGRSGMSRPVLVRLVHGYNMRDCMRIKGYEVELLHDTRRRTGDESGGGMPAVESPSSQLQTWKLTSSTGDVQIWVTSMIRAYDLAETSMDVRSMAFPRVNVPDAQGWFPKGLTWFSLRHPIENTKRFLRAKWNASRCDWLTFLGLRRPAWVSEDVLTLVASSRGRSVPSKSLDAVTATVCEVHSKMYHELLEWRQSSRVEDFSQ